MFRGISPSIQKFQSDLIFSVGEIMDDKLEKEDSKAPEASSEKEERIENIEITQDLEIFAVTAKTETKTSVTRHSRHGDVTRKVGILAAYKKESSDDSSSTSHMSNSGVIAATASTSALLLNIENPDIRVVIKFLVKEEKSAAEIHLRLQRPYRDVCMGASSVRRWVKHFEDGNTSIQDEHRSGCPGNASTERNKERVDEF
ncbi:hypothetical protein ANN_18802 [Periplaneta americana]|uniref:Mos1 transposase HTH domain-containing protein n=1 Tax=Periplaneta americana TaxID=6978 RepID=A0ABQ8SR61_PERAM|nr:hypothetical protein ANN_18802 [Periplaneta americana]